MENVKLVVLDDRISNLPDNVAETILMCLTTRDAVRTSILSRKWRHVWTKLPHFVLDKTFWENVDTKDSAEITLTTILLQLLLRRDGQIKKFTLSNPKLKSCLEIDDLICFLEKSHVEEFTLEMWKDRYLLPSSFFKCQELRHLKLWSCTIRTPPSFKGFCRLTSLKLIDVTIRTEALQHLISSSPLLELLELISIICTGLYIDATNLRTFRFHGFTNSIIFKRVPLLASVTILLEDESTGTIDFKGVGGNLVKFFDSFTFLEYLHLNHKIVQGFVDINHRKLATSLICLKELQLDQISFNDIIDISFMFCLLRSVPNLKFIEILFADYLNSNSEETMTYMEGEDYSDICVNELQKVNLKGVTGTKPELEFTKLLLAKSSSLKTIQIQPKDDVVDNGFKILKEVTKFRRISKEARILFG